MWAAGVILLSIMSRSYPFFRAPDDIMALVSKLLWKQVFIATDIY